MWEQYKKTFTSIQVLIAIVTIGVLVAFRMLAVAGVFFVTMEACAMIGAGWAFRLKQKHARLPHFRA